MVLIYFCAAVALVDGINMWRWTVVPRHVLACFHSTPRYLKQLQESLQRTSNKMATIPTLGECNLYRIYLQCSNLCSIITYIGSNDSSVRFVLLQGVTAGLQIGDKAHNDASLAVSIARQACFCRKHAPILKASCSRLPLSPAARCLAPSNFHLLSFLLFFFTFRK